MFDVRLDGQGHIKGWMDMISRLVTQPAKASRRQGLKIATVLVWTAGFSWTGASPAQAGGLSWGPTPDPAPTFQSEVVQSIGRFMSPSRIELFEGKLYVADTRRGHVAIYDTNGVRTGTITGVQAPLGLAVGVAPRRWLSPDVTRWMGRRSLDYTGRTGRLSPDNTRRIERLFPNNIRPTGRLIQDFPSLKERLFSRLAPEPLPTPQLRVYVGDRDTGSVKVFENGVSVGHLGSGAGEFLMPNAIAVNGGRIYVVDSKAGQVRYYNDRGQFEGAFGAPAVGSDLDTPPEPDQFGFATDIAIDPVTGEVFVSDWGANRVSVWDRDGFWLRNIEAPLNDGGEAVFLQPIGLGMDGAGNLYVVDNALSSVTVMDQGGFLVDVFGYQFGQYHTGELRIPVDAASDGGRVYVTSSDDGRVQVFEVRP